MLRLFGKKEKSIRVTDKIWMFTVDKLKACADIAKARPETIFIAWFDETYGQLETYFVKENIPVDNLYMASRFPHQPGPGKKIIFAEHYPLPGKEKSFFMKFSFPAAEVFSALDEPLFKKMGSDQIIGMMQKMGMDEKASIENKMVSNAIRNAQEKIEKQVVAEQNAASQDEWIQKNMKR